MGYVFGLNSQWEHPGVVENAWDSEPEYCVSGLPLTLPGGVTLPLWVRVRLDWMIPGAPFRSRPQRRGSGESGR
jgi:hypothetical protein